MDRWQRDEIEHGAILEPVLFERCIDLFVKIHARQSMERLCDFEVPSFARLFSLQTNQSYICVLSTLLMDPPNQFLS